ncbi:tyrosine-protein phosphatase [Paenibacillus gorillae]|uniref:tyrosine-protein phosphatase n=1 Tax=Paenibacillus gorillae TaxID=1243662 RepID=UPI0004B8F0E4|nr:tyrosine-protein phosphatase [Paenibacillus gorillae]
MQQLISFQGARNFRDLGGCRTADGRKVKQGLFFRSDELSGLTEQDKEHFKSLNIKTIFDYRSDYEVLKKPDPIFPGVNQLHVQAIGSGGLSLLNMPEEHGAKEDHQDHFIIALLKQGFFKQYRTDTMMMDLYEKLPIDNPAYRRLMEMVQHTDNLALLQHCTAGKDRTGVGSALILMALGVSEAVIMEDYLLTNEIMKETHNDIMHQLAGHASDAELHNIEQMLGIKEEYLEAVFRSIKDKFRDYETYLAVEFALTVKSREALQNMCLE